MMTSLVTNDLDQDPILNELAKELGIVVPENGSAFVLLKQFALDKVADLLIDSGVTHQKGLERFLSERLSCPIELIQRDRDIKRINDLYFENDRAARLVLKLDFEKGNTEGITLNFPEKDYPKHLAIIDARNDLRSRAYYTMWHEIAHLLILPEHQAPENVRRAPNDETKRKDPVEVLVDSIAGDLAYYPTFFEPILMSAIERYGEFGFQAITWAKNRTAHKASLMAAIIASIQYQSNPIVFVSIKPSRSSSGRIIQCIPNLAAKLDQLSISKQLRPPEVSVLVKAFDQKGKILKATENQSFWEDLNGGYLQDRIINVEALCRGQYSYGLITY